MRKKNSLPLLLSLISMNNNVFLTLKEFSTSISYKGKAPIYPFNVKTHVTYRRRNNAKEVCVVKLPMLYINSLAYSTFT